jgi:hypothetical protein
MQQGKIPLLNFRDEQYHCVLWLLLVHTPFVMDYSRDRNQQALFKKAASMDVSYEHQPPTGVCEGIFFHVPWLAPLLLSCV